MEGNNFLYSLIKTAHYLPDNSAVIICQHEWFGEKKNLPVWLKEELSAAPAHVRTVPPVLSYGRGLLLFSVTRDIRWILTVATVLLPLSQMHFFFFFFFSFLVSSSSPQLKIGQPDFLVVSPSHPRASSELARLYDERMSHDVFITLRCSSSLSIRSVWLCRQGEDSGHQKFKKKKTQTKPVAPKYLFHTANQKVFHMLNEESWLTMIQSCNPSFSIINLSGKIGETEWLFPPWGRRTKMLLFTSVAWDDCL